jgi:regulator of sirC expression with transglutaminase-like and TPR domain
MRLVFALALMLAVAAVVKPVSAQQGSESCTALLVGNSNYKSSGEPALREPVNDARSMGEELKRTGFDVEVRENLTKEAMQRAIDGFYGKLRTGMTGLLFFSGYGIQANRESFLIPVDADIFNESEVRTNGISLDAVLAEMNRRGAAVKIAIIDAARRFNPFENRFRRPGAGLAPPSSPRGTLVMYSATAGTPGDLVRPSGTDRGLFVGELLKEIRAPGAAAEEVFNRTRMGVSRASSGDQNPWMSSSLSQEFLFSNCRLDVAVDRDRDHPGPPIQSQQVDCKVANVPPPKPTCTPPSNELRKLNDRVRRKDAAAFYRRGQLYAQCGEFTRAIVDFDHAIRLNPGDPEALNNRCWARTILGDTSQALHDCNNALMIHPDYGDALDSRGLIYLKQCRNADALADYDTALRYNPQRASSLFGRGIAKLRTGDRGGGENDIVMAKGIMATIAEEFRGYGITAPSEVKSQQ